MTNALNFITALSTIQKSANLQNSYNCIIIYNKSNTASYNNLLGNDSKSSVRDSNKKIINSSSTKMQTNTFFL